MSAAKLSRPKKVRFAHPLPHHRLAKTQIICAILPRRRGEGDIIFFEDRWDRWDNRDWWDADEA